MLGAAGVDLAVERGEICVLMGLSGSGKSTLLRAVNGLNKVARGKVLVEHDGTHGRRRPLRRQATLRAPHAHASPWCSSSSRCCPGARCARMSASASSCAACRRPSATAVVDEKLALVGLTHWADKYAHELSGGMQQRVGLARAFATDADILLMDEPFSALDPLIRDKLQDELLELQQTLQQDHRLRQPRPRRGAEDRQPHRHHGGRPHRPGRHRRGHRPQPGQRLCRRIRQHMNPLNVLRGTLGDDARPSRSAASRAPSSSTTRPRAGPARRRRPPDRRDARRPRGEARHRRRRVRHAPPSQCDIIVAPVDLKLRAGDRAEAPDRPPDPARRPARPPRRPLRRRGDLPRPPEAGIADVRPAVAEGAIPPRGPRFARAKGASRLSPQAGYLHFATAAPCGQKGAQFTSPRLRGEGCRRQQACAAGEGEGALTKRALRRGKAPFPAPPPHPRFASLRSFGRRPNPLPASGGGGSALSVDGTVGLRRKDERSLDGSK